MARIADFTRITGLGLAIALPMLVASGRAEAVTIAFENFAPTGSWRNVNPAQPYEEAGFRLTPTANEAAVFDGASGGFMIQNATAYFGFSRDNVITLSSIAGVPFSVSGLLVGPTILSAAHPPSVDVTFVGNLADGSSVTDFLPGLTGSTSWTFTRFTNLTSLVISASNAAGFDDINITLHPGVAPVPEPATLLLVGAGIAGVAMKLRRRRVSSASRTLSCWSLPDFAG